MSDGWDCVEGANAVCDEEERREERKRKHYVAASGLSSFGHRERNDKQRHEER